MSGVCPARFRKGWFVSSGVCPADAALVTLVDVIVDNARVRMMTKVITTYLLAIFTCLHVLRADEESQHDYADDQ